MATEVFTTTDKAQRDKMFFELRNSDDVLERKAVKFSGVRSDGKQIYSVAYPLPSPDFVLPNHGSKRSPRTFPGRKAKV